MDLGQVWHPTAPALAALANLPSESSHLVPLDLPLPDIQGDEVIDELRANPATVHVPIVIVTADATPGLDERLSHAGADGLITKPVDVDSVLGWLDRAAPPDR